MNEKDTALLSDDYGRDLASVQALQRKHEGLERDLAALEDKVTMLGEEARRLQGRHPNSADQIAAKQAEIVGLWEGLKRKVGVSLCPLSRTVFFTMALPDLQASKRGARLEDAQRFQKFLGDYRFVTEYCIFWLSFMYVVFFPRELLSWVNEMQALVSADELAKDVAGAEALLQRHRERKVGGREGGREVWREGRKERRKEGRKEGR